MKKKYKTYRCEWVVQIFEVDEYNHRIGGSTGCNIYYENIHYIAEDAYGELDFIAPKHNFIFKRVWKDAPHSYHDAGVLYREVLVSTSLE